MIYRPNIGPNINEFIISRPFIGSQVTSVRLPKPYSKHTHTTTVHPQAQNAGL